MSLFKKRKNLNIRQRRTDEDEEEVTESLAEKSTPLHDNSNDLNRVDTPQVKPQITGPTETFFEKKEKKKTKPKREKKPTVLSFEDELEADDGITFQEKKSSLSYKLRKEMKRERKEKKREERDKLRQGKEKSTDKNSPLSVADLDDLGIRIVNGREAEAIAAVPGDSDESGDDKGTKKPIFRSRPKMEDTPLQPWKAALQSGHIPDANLIHQIRKERQKARERGDFVPVDDTVRLEEAQGRLIREDDNDRSDDDEDRLKFSVNQDEVDRKQRREAFEAAQAGEDSDHDAEWEMQQLRKAGATTAKLSLDQDQNREKNGDVSAQPSFGATASLTQPPSSGEASSLWGVTDSLTALSSVGLDRPVNYQAEGIIKRLRDSRESLTEVFRRHQSEADAIIDDLVAAKAAVTRCTADQEPLTETFRFFQDMRGYVTDLRECLNEKMAEIKRLEEQVYLIYRQKAQKLVQRRRQDVKDQNNEFSPFAGKMAKGDEYRVRRAAEREGRRTRRRRERERKGDVIHHDGMSTDDEEATSQRQTMQSELESIAIESKKVFEDVEEEFAQLQRLMVRFEGWKTVESTSYADAYVTYNLPKVFAPYIRLQLVLWNPLSKDGEAIEIDKMKWFNQLLLYGFEGAPEISLSQFKQDPDRNLMSHIVEKVILSKLKDIASCFWDPLSHYQSVRLVNLVRNYTSTYPSISPNSKSLKELMLAVIAKIRDAIENDVFIPMFPKSIYENKTSGVSLFFQRQFWSSLKLLASVLMWHRIFSDSAIHDLAIRSLLNLYLLPALNLASEINVSDALEKTRHVINVLPREWSKNEGGTHAFLGRLEAFLVSLAEKLDPTANNVELKEICELLRAIGARTQSETLANKYL